MPIPDYLIKMPVELLLNTPETVKESYSLPEVEEPLKSYIEQRHTAPPLFIEIRKGDGAVLCYGNVHYRRG